MPLTSLNHYLIVSRNLERSKDFYSRVLGMKLAPRPDFGFPGYWLRAGSNVCVHLASKRPNKIRDIYLLKKHARGVNGSGSVDHVAFVARNPDEVRKRIRKHGLKMHFRSLPEDRVFQIFLKDPDDITVELNFYGTKVDPRKWRGRDAASSVVITPSGKRRPNLTYLR
jgi:catechol 2,3-dioxygenase-like lactoylglutathione lyase family enzyme